MSVRHYSKLRFVPKSGVFPRNFLVGGSHCGVKKDSAKLDLALIASVTPATAAAVFTTNVFKAAPVQLSKQILESSAGSNIQSVVINSGNANAVTGKQGLVDAQAMVDTVRQVRGGSGQSLVMSTGVIGNTLPIDKIVTGIKALARDSSLGSDYDAWLRCANAICTTDTFPKLVTREFKLGSAKYRIAGLAKGAGMIHPNMATLLGVFATDAPISAPALQQSLGHAVDRSFNCISVDGDMSTNDTISLLANGTGKPLEPQDPEFEQFQSHVTEVAQELAQLVVRDGEGATKFVTIKVAGAKTYDEAKTVASTVAQSSLVKTAVYGQDANWGRILCAIGYSEVTGIDPSRTNVSFMPTDGSAELKLLVNGEPETVDEARASQVLALEDVEIRIDLGVGSAAATFWTCDLSHEYVTINGDYRS